MTPRPATVSVRIGRLVLDGVSPAERARVEDGLRDSLIEAVTEWMASGGAAGAPSEHRRRLAPVHLGAPVDRTPSALGRSIGSTLAGVVLDQPGRST